MKRERDMSDRTRFRILKRDHFTCMYCGAHPPYVSLEVDHYWPVSKGGPDDDYNLIAACFRCNRGKRDDVMESEPCPDGCKRPGCGGPRNARDELEWDCRCDCHVCDMCKSPHCPSGNACPKYPEWAADYDRRTKEQEA